MLISFLLLLLATACMASVGVGLWVVGNHFLTTDIPAAISHPVRLWVFNCIFQLLITWVSFVCPLLQRIISLGQEDPLEKEMATHFSALAWKIPWKEEPDRPLQSMGLQRVGHN